MIEQILKPSASFRVLGRRRGVLPRGRQDAALQLHSGCFQTPGRRRPAPPGGGGPGGFACNNWRTIAMNLLVTGGAGFIGSNLIHHIIDKPEIRLLVNLDCLTYAGHLENLEAVGRHPKYVFEKADLRDKTAVARRGGPPRHHPCPASGGGIARGPLHHRPGRFHPDQHCRHLPPSGSGAGRLDGPLQRKAFPPRLHRRSLWQPGADGVFHRDHALRAQFALFGQQGGERFSGARLSPHLRPAGGDDQLLQQLRPLPVPRKTHPGHHRKPLLCAGPSRFMATA